MLRTRYTLSAILTFGIYSAQAADIPKLPAKADAIVMPRIEFREAKIEECVEFLKKRSRELDPEKIGVNITLAGHKDEVTPISFHGQKATIGQAVLKLVEIANLKVRVEGNTIHLTTNLKEPRLIPTLPPTPPIPKPTSDPK
jgi:hypothetical protein